MSTGFDTANGVPSDGVRNALGDLQVAVRADPGLVIIGVSAGAGLNRVFDVPFEFRAHPTESNAIKVERHMLGCPLVWATAWFGCATH